MNFITGWWFQPTPVFNGIYNDFMGLKKSDSMGYSWDIPSGKHSQFAIEHGPVEIVKIYPARKWWIFPYSYVAVYQRVYIYIYRLRYREHVGTFINYI